MGAAMNLRITVDHKPPFEDFYRSNIGLVHKVAGRVHARMLAVGAAIEMDDIVQEASMTMLKAYRGFDPSKGFAFSSYFTRAALYDLNRLTKMHDRDARDLGVMSLHGRIGEDGEAIDMESTIDGAHGSPEEMLECKQLLARIGDKLSPLAYKMLEVMLDPPEQFEREWAIQRELGDTHLSEMSLAFVAEFVGRLTNANPLEIVSARREISRLRASLLKDEE